VADRAHKSQAETPKTETQLDELPLAPRRSSARLTLVASLSALVGGAAAAAYFASALPKFDSFGERFPHAAAPVPTADDPAVSAALNDIRSLQQQNAAALHESGAALQQSTAMLQQSATTLVSLRESFTAQQTDLKRISDQLSSLITRVESLQNGSPLTTASIPQAKPRAQVASRKKTSRLPKPFGPVSVGGAPLSPAPASASGAG
jgi:uncharacterized coiled-coil protein SlyX